jgi:hypothetical protein
MGNLLFSQLNFPIYRQFVQVAAMSKHYGVFRDLFKRRTYFPNSNSGSKICTAFFIRQEA